jgi:hypothetical protein
MAKAKKSKASSKAKKSTSKRYGTSKKPMKKC